MNTDDIIKIYEARKKEIKEMEEEQVKLKSALKRIEHIDKKMIKESAKLKKRSDVGEDKEIKKIKQTIQQLKHERDNILGSIKINKPII